MDPAALVQMLATRKSIEEAVQQACRLQRLIRTMKWTKHRGVVSRAYFMQDTSHFVEERNMYFVGILYLEYHRSYFHSATWTFESCAWICKLVDIFLMNASKNSLDQGPIATSYFSRVLAPLIEIKLVLKGGGIFSIHKIYLRSHNKLLPNSPWLYLLASEMSSVHAFYERTVNQQS